MKKTVTVKEEGKIDDRLRQLLMLRKEDMTMGQLFELARYRPEEMDGYIFEQKINRTISEEFERLQSKVDLAANTVMSFHQKLGEIESKGDILRSQLSRISKFDSSIESLTRMSTDQASQMQGLSDRLMDLFTQFRQNNEVLGKRINTTDFNIKEINKLIDEPDDIKKKKQQMLDDMIDRVEMRLTKKHLELEKEFQQQSNDTTESRLYTQKIVSHLQTSFEALNEPFIQHGYLLKEHTTDLQRHKRVIEELSEHLVAVKKYTQLTNLHMEAYLPFQISSQIYEQCQMFAATGKVKAAFRKNFTAKIEALEQNLLNCCNPTTFGQYKSPYRKITYDLPTSYLQPEVLPDDAIPNAEITKKIAQKMKLFMKEKLQRDATRDSSINNVFILFGGVSLDSLAIKLREDMFGFKYGDEYVFKINKEREQAQIEKAAADLAKGIAAPVADFGALRMQVNYELMKSKVNVEALVKKTFSELSGAFDILQEKMGNKFLKVDGTFDKLNEQLEKNRQKDDKILLTQQELIQEAEDKVSEVLNKQADLEKRLQYQSAETKSFVQENLQGIMRKFKNLQDGISSQVQLQIDESQADLSKKKLSFSKDTKLIYEDRIDDRSVIQELSGQSQISDAQLSVSLEREKKTVQPPTQKIQKILRAPSQKLSTKDTQKEIAAKSIQLFDDRQNQESRISSDQREQIQPIIQDTNNKVQDQHQVKNDDDYDVVQQPTQIQQTQKISLQEKVGSSLVKNIQERVISQQIQEKPVVVIEKETQKVFEEAVTEVKFASHQVSPKVILEQDETTPLNSQSSHVNTNVDSFYLKPQSQLLLTQESTDERKVVFSETNQSATKYNTSTTTQLNKEQQPSQLIKEPSQQIKVQVTEKILKEQITFTQSSQQSYINNQKIPNNPYLGVDIVQENKVSDNQYVPSNQEQVMRNNMNKLKNDRIQDLIIRQNQGTERLKNIGQEIKNIHRIVVREVVDTASINQGSIQQIPNLQVFSSVVELAKVTSSVQELATPSKKRTDSQNSKRSKLSNGKRKLAAPSLNQLRTSKQSSQRISAEEGSLPLIESEYGDLDDYDQEEDQAMQELMDMSSYMKNSVFNNYKISQSLINQQFVEEIERRDIIMAQMHEELLEYNADILAFLGVINDVDFRIMDKAENTINDSIAKYESMFDNFKQVLSSDVKRWRQENIDTKNNVQRNTLRHDELQKFVTTSLSKQKNFGEQMLYQFQNLSEVWDLQIRLNKQDDQDKLSTSLIGIREKEQVPSSLPGRNQPQSQAPSLSLDPRCLNCENDSGQKQIIFQKFKMACLSYKPSPIILDSGLSVSRDECFQLQQQSIKSIQESQFSTRNQLESLNNIVQKALEDIDRQAGVNRHGQTISEQESKKYDDLKDRKTILSQAVTSTQTLDANRFAQLRKDMKTQPGSSRPVHKILVLENIQAGKNSARGPNSLPSMNGLTVSSIGSEYQANVTVQNYTDRTNRNFKEKIETNNSLALPMLTITPRSVASDLESKAHAAAVKMQRFSQTNGFRK